MGDRNELSRIWGELIGTLNLDEAILNQCNLSRWSFLCVSSEAHKIYRWKGTLRAACIVTWLSCAVDVRSLSKLALTLNSRIRKAIIAGTILVEVAVYACVSQSFDTNKAQHLVNSI